MTVYLFKRLKKRIPLFQKKSSVMSRLLCRLSRRYFLSGQGKKSLHSLVTEIFFNDGQMKRNPAISGDWLK